MGLDNDSAQGGQPSAPQNGQQGAGAAGSGAPARAQDDAPITMGALRALLVEERAEFDKRLNRAITTRLNRIKADGSNGAAPSNGRGHARDDEDDEDADLDDDGHDGGSDAAVAGRASAERPQQGQRSDPRTDRMSRRERAEMRAMKERLKTLETEREQNALREQRRVREESFRDLVKRSDPADVDDAFRILIADPSLKVSDDGQEFFVVGSGGAEVDLEDWVKKEIGRRAHLQKQPAREARPAVGRAGPAPQPSKGVDRSMPADKRLERLHAAKGQ